MSRKVASGDAIRSIRELAGYSQAAFAEEIGVSRQALALVEAGSNGMKAANLKRAANALGVPVPSLTQSGFTPAEACAALHISREELDQLIADGELPMISGCVTETALEEYIARQLPEMAATP